MEACQSNLKIHIDLDHIHFRAAEFHSLRSLSGLAEKIKLKVMISYVRRE